AKKLRCLFLDRSLQHQPGPQPAQFGEALVVGQSLAQQLLDRALQDAAGRYSCRHDVVLLLGGFPDLPRETTSFYFYSAVRTRPPHINTLTLLSLNLYGVVE